MLTIQSLPLRKMYYYLLQFTLVTGINPLFVMFIPESFRKSVAGTTPEVMKEK